MQAPLGTYMHNASKSISVCCKYFEGVYEPGTQADPAERSASASGSKIPVACTLGYREQVAREKRGRGDTSPFCWI
jgi:hypothetical protein